MFLKDEIGRKDKVINILLDSFSNHVPEHSNSTTFKNTDVTTQTKHQTESNIQISTAVSNHRTIIASEKSGKNQKKLNINQLNSGTCGKTHVNNSHNNEEREPLDQDDENMKVKELLSNSIPTLYI